MKKKKYKKLPAIRGEYIVQFIEVSGNTFRIIAEKKVPWLKQAMNLYNELTLKKGKNCRIVLNGNVIFDSFSFKKVNQRKNGKVFQVTKQNKIREVDYDPPQRDLLLDFILNYENERRNDVEKVKFSQVLKGSKK